MAGFSRDLWRCGELNGDGAANSMKMAAVGTVWLGPSTSFLFFIIPRSRSGSNFGTRLDFKTGSGLGFWIGSGFGIEVGFRHSGCGRVSPTRPQSRNPNLTPNLREIFGGYPRVTILTRKLNELLGVAIWDNGKNQKMLLETQYGCNVASNLIISTKLISGELDIFGYLAPNLFLLNHKNKNHFHAVSSVNS
ncbi:hypothetical protein TIFTF001_020451 [Ficus carica]|uniref:Uncharacterized protein n=1 Tax=Ficus carica TaxID=3494 RepID=A0AA88DJL5_FICCA|nr:hypothetical protein TIFTF001_020451 [Ficus carica]